MKRLVALSIIVALGLCACSNNQDAFTDIDVPTIPTPASEKTIEKPETTPIAEHTVETTIKTPLDLFKESKKQSAVIHEVTISIPVYWETKQEQESFFAYPESNVTFAVSTSKTQGYREGYLDSEIFNSEFLLGFESRFGALKYVKNKVDEMDAIYFDAYWDHFSSPTRWYVLATEEYVYTIAIVSPDNQFQEYCKVLGEIVGSAIIEKIPSSAESIDSMHTVEPIETPAGTIVPMATKHPAPEETDDIEATSNSPKITMAEFNSIHEGMTYSQVVEIIGGQGELLSEAGAELGSEYHAKMYMWEGSGSTGANANAMFQGGKLITKAQFGLK